MDVTNSTSFRTPSLSLSSLGTVDNKQATVLESSPRQTTETDAKIQGLSQGILSTSESKPQLIKKGSFRGSFENLTALNPEKTLGAVSGILSSKTQNNLLAGLRQVQFSKTLFRRTSSENIISLGLGDPVKHLIPLKGGEKLVVNVPSDRAKLSAVYDELKEGINSRIKIQESEAHKIQAKSWKNSATSATDLNQHAKESTGEFRSFVQGIARSLNAEVDVGKNICKTSESLDRKIKSDVAETKRLGTYESDEKCVQAIGDSLRSTLFFDTPEELSAAVHNIQNECKSPERNGWDVTIKNKWAEKSSPSGYVGVHAKMKMVNAEGKTILCEIQLHLNAVCSKDANVKKATDDVYHETREVKQQISENQESVLQDASKLAFTLGMLNVPKPESQQREE